MMPYVLVGCLPASMGLRVGSTVGHGQRQQRPLSPIKSPNTHVLLTSLTMPQPVQRDAIPERVTAVA